MRAIPRDAFIEVNARAAEYIEGAADGDVHVAPANVVSELEVGEAAGTASVSDRNPLPLAEQAEQVFVHAAALAFDVGSVNEEFRAVTGEGIESLRRYAKGGARLPPVHAHRPATVRITPAREVDDEPVLSCGIIHSR